MNHLKYLVGFGFLSLILISIYYIIAIMVGLGLYENGNYTASEIIMVPFIVVDVVDQMLPDKKIGMTSTSVGVGIISYDNFTWWFNYKTHVVYLISAFIYFIIGALVGHFVWKKKRLPN